ncbi:unnamed protein product [Victoria cruziana]
MAWLMKLGRKACISSSTALFPKLHCRVCQPSPSASPCSFSKELLAKNQTRHYISRMRKSAFEDHIMRLLRSEIQYEMEVAPPKEAVSVFSSFAVEGKPGEQWIRLRRKYGDDEDIKVEVTMFDGFQGTGDKGEDVQMHISLIVDVSKGDESNPLEFICSAWPNALVVRKVFMLKRHKMPPKPYIGPDFAELDDELQDALQEFLEARGVNDELAIFLHQYMLNKDKAEYIHWLEKVKSFVAK